MLRKLKLYNLLYFIPMPVFFTTTGIYRGSALNDDTFALPISIIVFFAVFFCNTKYIGVLLGRRTILLLIFLLYSILIFVLKIIFSGSDLNPNLLLVSTMPLLVSFCFGYKLKPYLIRGNLIKIVNKVVFVFSLFCMAHLLSSIVSLGVVGTFINRGEDSVFGLFSVYQKLVYYPTMVSCFFILSLFTTLKYKYIYSTILLLVVLMTGAREALLISIFGIISSTLLNKKVKSVNNILKYFVLILIIFILIVYFIEPIKEICESAPLITKLKNLSESSDITAGRTGAIHTVFGNSAADFNLLIGTGYSMNLGDFRSPHNQYAEVLLRSGAIGLSLFFVFIVGILRNMLINIKQYRYTIIRYVIYSFVVVYLCLLFISFNVNVPVRAPYTAILFGFLSGFFYNIEIPKLYSSNLGERK